MTIELPTKKKKILILATELDFGGVETSILSRSIALSKYDYELEFACLYKLGKIGKQLQSYGFKVHNLDTNPKIQNLKNVFSVAKLLRQVKPDILHTICIEANFHSALAVSLAGVKKVVAEEVGISINETVGVIRSWRARQASKLVWKRADVILAISNAVKDYLIKYEGANESKIKIIPHFITDTFSPQVFGTTNNSSKEFIIGCVGRLSHEKGQQILLSAFHRAFQKNENLRLWLVGEGNERSTLEKQALKLGISEFVKFWGARSDIADLLSQMNLFVLPSLTEGFGIAILEAMTVGIPVIATKVGGVPDIIEHEKNGILVSADDIETLSNEIIKMVNLDSTTKEKMVFEAKDTVAAKFSENCIMSQLFNLYEIIQ